jgi:hypothetical protein
MQDFMGRPYKVGDFVAAGGAGNVKAEYGMILYKILEIAPKLKLIRLDVSYPNHSEVGMVVKARKVTAKNTNKYAVVKPPAVVKGLFNRAVAGKLRKGEAQTIGKWVHGADHQVGLF